ncbi:hypothetical protein BH11PSE8_BH11PSE8_12270 [soil metagenome]
MKTLKISLLAAMLGASSLALAAEMGSDAAREQRMTEALDRYHDSRDASPGPAARAEESMKRGAHRMHQDMKHGAHRMGEGMKHGAHRTGEAMKHGAHKTGEAAHRMGEKMEHKMEGKPKTDQ